MSCSSLPPREIIVHVPTPLAPPENLTEKCVSISSDGTVSAELQRLSSLVKCERDDKAAIREWAAQLGVSVGPPL